MLPAESTPFPTAYFTMSESKSEEQFIQRQMLKAALLSAVVMGLYVYLAPRPEPLDPPPTATERAPDGGAAGDAAAAGERSRETEQAAADAVMPAETPAAGAAVVRAERERQVTVETDTFTVTFTNRGAAARGWTLVDYDDSLNMPLDLVHQQGAERFGRPFRLVEPGGKPIAGSDDALFTVNNGPDVRKAPATLRFEFSDGSLSIRKTFAFRKEGYLVGVETEVIENGRPRRHLVEWGGGFGDTAQVQDYVHSQTFYFDKGELVRNEADDAEDERLANSGRYAFVGIADLFFAAAAIPEEDAEIDLETGAVEITPAGSEADDEQLFASAAFGGADRNRFEFYVGPKSLEELAAVERVGPALRRVVDFGFFAFIAEPIFAMLRWVYDHVVSNWGWSIVLVTVFINFLLFPLKYKSSKSMKRMQQVQPLIKQINDKYKGLSMRDPKKAKQSEELQAIYKKYGVNPMGGCLPMLLQMPFFFAFYKLLTVAIEMRHADWLWVTDLAAPESLAIRILPLAMVATQFWSQSLTPTPTADPTQAKVMKLMPIMFGFIFYQFQAGLVLYWLTSNVVGVGQQYFLNRLPAEEITLEHSPRRGKKRKK